METYRNIIKHVDLRQAAGKGPCKLDKASAQALRPKKAEIAACQVGLLSSGSPTVCANMSLINLEELPIHHEGGDPTRNVVDVARRAAHLVMRACPVANHASPEARVNLPCGGVLYELDSFLDKI